MSLIRRELNIFSCIYWLFAFFVVWTAFHILCPFLGWCVHIYSHWFVWALCKIRKFSFCQLYVLQISCTILSFVSWLHGICFHKDILIFMWSNSLIFALWRPAWWGEESAMRLSTSLPSWSFVEPESRSGQRLRQGGWNVCELCVHQLWVLGRVLGQPLPQTWDNTPFTSHLCDKRQPIGLIFTLTENSLSGASSPHYPFWPWWGHYRPSSKLHNSDLQEIKSELFVPFLLGGSLRS